MSKSRGNVVSPDDVIERYGTDSMRLYEMFMGPLDKGAPWSDEAIPGVYRFLQRAYRLLVEDGDGGERLVDLADGPGSPEQQRLTARAIHGVTEDIEAMRFNTAISKLMVFSREIARDAATPREAAEVFVLLLAPFAPHLAEELWRRLGHPQSLAAEPWPTADAALLEESHADARRPGQRQASRRNRSARRRRRRSHSARSARQPGRRASTRRSRTQARHHRPRPPRQHRRLTSNRPTDSIRSSPGVKHTATREKHRCNQVPDQNGDFDETKA